MSAERTSIRPFVPAAQVASATTIMQTESVLGLLDARVVRFAAPPPEPITAYRMNGQSICTGGNLTVISAQAKAGKTAVLSAMISAPFATDNTCDYLGFEAVRAEGKSILVFDTEQSPHDAWQIQKRILRRARLQVQPPELQHFYLLDLSCNQRREAVMEGTRRAAGNGAVQAVFIDGVADLMDDVNNAGEANSLVSDLVSLAVEIGSPIITVVHENPQEPGGSGKTRGHLGSQLERKAESNLRIVKDRDGISTIFGEKCRRASIPRHFGPRFQWDDVAQMHTGLEPARVAKAEEATERFRKDLDDIFNGPDAPSGYSHKALLERICEVAKLTRGGARKRFDKFRESGAISQNGQGLWIRRI